MEQSLLRRTVQNSASGTVAGIAVCLTGHPFDTLKVRLQTQPIGAPIYSGVVDCFVKTLKWEGIGGLYKGVGSPLVGQMFFRAIAFTSYYQFSSILQGEDKTKRLSKGKYFIAGAGTGAVSAMVEGPIDLFKTKMQIQIMRAKAGESVQYRNVFHAGWMISKTYGLRGAYQGLGATAVRNIPANSLYFGVFEIGRTHFTPEGGSVSDIPVSRLLVCGGCAGFSYWFFTYPTDVIKSAMQSDSSNKQERKFTNIIDCIKRLYTEEGGAKRFFRGFTPCLMRSVPANATMLTVLELCRQLFPS